MNTAIQNTGIAPSTYFYDPQLGVYITIRTIDPVMAKELLEGNHKNRRISPFSVKRYRDFMENNQWVMNGEPIIFGGNKLIDGQHRLTACIDAGKSFQSVWIELRDDGAFKTLNQGKRRNPADVLSIEGHVNVSVLNTAITMLARIDESGELPYQGFGGGTRLSIPNHEINDWAKKYPHLGISVKKCQGWYRNFRIKKGPFSTLHYLLRRSETHLFDFNDESGNSNADKFCDSLCNGLDLSKGSPILPYRNHLLRMMSANEKISPHYIIRGGILSYNAWLTGQKSNVCRVGRITKIPKILKAHG
tara:strand:+ start:223 stop:1134 length:912 start_codon:yes stop_codon:yes gene_type:complete